MRKTAAVVKIFDQFFRLAFHLLQGSRTRERGFAVTTDLDPDFGGCGQGLVRDQQARSERATAVVDFGLWQIERIFALDISGTHVVSDRVAGNFAARADKQHQLWFRHRPGRILANCDLRIRPHHSMRGRFKEKLGPRSLIDAIVKVSAPGALRLLHARAAAAVISDARGPDLLAAYRWRL